MVEAKSTRRTSQDDLRFAGLAAGRPKSHTNLLLEARGARPLARSATLRTQDKAERIARAFDERRRIIFGG